jgi:sulfite oxidase
VAAGKIRVRGYAVPPGGIGAAVSRVEVSPDDGKTWTEARFRGNRSDFAWQLWEADVTVPAGTSTLVVRATDSRGTPQPEHAAWNFKGYLNDSWHRIRITAS